jgi:AraC-like DNA-binding protein
MDTLFSIAAPSVIEALNGGLFISPGEWIHKTRQIDSFELILVREGVVNLFEEKQSFNVNPGEMLLLAPGKTHGGTEVYCGKLSFYWLHFKIREVAVSGKSHHLELPQHLMPADSHCLSMLFRQYLNDQAQGLLTPLRAELLILQILSEAARAPRSTDASNIVAEQVFRFIAEHYQEPVSTASIAHELQRNPDYIGRCFKNAYKYTITEEINRRRLLEAEKLLIDKDLNLNEIAAQCGFNDSGYFRKLFVCKNGITPGKFRRRLSRIYINTL